MTERKVDDGLNSISPAVNLLDDKDRFRNLIRPFRRRSHPDKLKFEIHERSPTKDRPVTKEWAQDNQASPSKCNPKLKPLFARDAMAKKDLVNYIQEKIRSEGSSSVSDDHDDRSNEGLSVVCEDVDEKLAIVLQKQVVKKPKVKDAPPATLKPCNYGEVAVKNTVTDSTKKLEFGGTVGVLINMIIMPLTVFMINAACDKEACTVLQWPRIPTSWSYYFDPWAWVMYLGWLALQLILHLAIPGRPVLGRPSDLDRQQLVYICNGYKAFQITGLGTASLLLLGVPASTVTDRVFGFITIATIFSFTMSILLYVKALHVPENQLSASGSTGHAVYDFYMGRELNPHLGPLDLKFFCELRPGLLAWVVLDLCYLAQQWQEQGFVSPALLMLVTFHLLYVGDALYYEDTVVTTLDMTTEGFGFMLAYGDLTWVPFTFSLQARFLSYHSQHWGVLAICTFILLNGIGYKIFRASNNQKDTFKQNPNHPDLKDFHTLVSSTGQRLLADGWWAWSRHPNYCGDLLMALAWSLPCGLDHGLPWFYMVYLTMALLHRTQRDDFKCAHKYGAIWSQYQQLVPYRIIPGIY